jgi:predicted phage-related endonuclease
MKIHNCIQGESEWLTARVGKVTASEACDLLTPKFAEKDGETPKTYLATKIAERILGRQVGEFSSFVTEEGEMLEMEARKWFEFQFDHKVKRVGFIEHDNGRCGCSPDALLDDDGGLEIKCPQPTNHVKYLLSGELPKDYAVQVHFSMYVTGRPWWKFVSYRRKMRPFVLTIQRDEEIIKKIDACLTKFYADFDKAFIRATSPA